MIHQNEINNEKVSLLESGIKRQKKKMFTANLLAVTVNIPERGWSLDLPLSATAVTTPVGCMVCGWPRCVYLEMNLKSGRTGKAHNPAK